MLALISRPEERVRIAHRANLPKQHLSPVGLAQGSGINDPERPAIAGKVLAPRSDPRSGQIVHSKPKSQKRSRLTIPMIRLINREEEIRIADAISVALRVKALEMTKNRLSEIE